MRGGSSREVLRHLADPLSLRRGRARSATSSCSTDSSRVGTRRPRRRSPSWCSGTGRWSWASAAASWAMRTRRRMPSRRPSWSWRGRRLRSCGARRSRAGSTASPCRTAKEARGRAARRRAREERVSTPVHVEPPDDGCSGRAAGDPGRGARPAAGAVSGAGGPLRARGPVAPGGGPTARHPRGNALQPAGAGQGPVAGPPGPARRRSLPSPPSTASCSARPGPPLCPFRLLESTVEAATLVAAGSSAAAAVSASVASLSEGVLKTMLLAKLKGIVLGVGTYDRVVSGAVVLAQRVRRRRASSCRAVHLLRSVRRPRPRIRHRPDRRAGEEARPDPRCPGSPVAADSGRS